MRKFIIGIAVLVILSAVAAWIFMGNVFSYVIDTSGSMVRDFSTVKQSILADLRHIGRFEVSYIVPFASNEGAYRRVTSRSSFSSVESYMSGLSAKGQYTNFEEGLDSAAILLTKERSRGQRRIILITDGISDPDSNHRMVSMEELSERLPRKMRLYIVDLSNRRYRYPTKRVGRFVGYTKPGSNFVIIPVQAERLSSLLPVLSGRSYVPYYPYSLFGLAGLAVMVIIIIILRGRQERDDLFEGEEIEDEESDKPNIVQVMVGDAERRFGSPVKLTIGSGKGNDFRIRGARRRELSVHICSNGNHTFKHRNGFFHVLKGQIYRSRQFTLKTGIPVTIRLNSAKRLHRYVKEA
jgi:hypothetical protein